MLTLLNTPLAKADFTNGSFETGNLDGWTVGGLTPGGSGVASDGTQIGGASAFAFAPAFVNARSGSFAAFAAVANATPNAEFLSLSQTVNIAPGSFSVGFYLGNDSRSSFGYEQAILDGRLAILVNGVSVPFTTLPGSTIISVGSNPSNFVQFASNFTTSGGPTLFELRISGSGNGRAGISIDDAFLTAPATGATAPEPGSLALLLPLLGGMSVVLQRHRKRSRYVMIQNRVSSSTTLKAFSRRN